MIKIKKQYVLAAMCATILVGHTSWALPLPLSSLEQIETYTADCKEDMLAIHSTLRSTDSNSLKQGIAFHYPHTMHHSESIGVTAKIFAIHSDLHHVEHRSFRQKHTCHIRCIVRFPVANHIGKYDDKAICSWEAGDWQTSMRAQSSGPLSKGFPVYKSSQKLDQELLNKLKDEF